jgi:hypothetical protein
VDTAHIVCAYTELHSVIIRCTVYRVDAISYCYAPINVRRGGEAGKRSGIWHSNKILCQISYPRDSSAGQIDRTQGQLKLFQRDFSNWIIHKGSILSLYLEIIGRLLPFFAKIYSRFSFEVWICLRLQAYPTIANIFPMISKYGQLPHIFNLLVHMSGGKTLVHVEYIT